MNYTYENFTAYYGGTPPSVLKEYANTETDKTRKEMFLKLAKELESGVIYAPRNCGQLSYKKVKET